MLLFFSNASVHPFRRGFGYATMENHLSDAPSAGNIMTSLQFTLPDDLALAAQEAGLLSSDALSRLLADAVKVRRVDELFAAINEMSANDSVPTMTAEQISAEINAVRAAQ